MARSAAFAGSAIALSFCAVCACQLVYPPGDITPSVAGGGPDAAADGAVDGGAEGGDASGAADPGIACNTAGFCRTADQVCCFNHCSGGLGSSCAAAGARCNDSCMTLLTCTSTANCAASPGTICCAILNSGLTIESTLCEPVETCKSANFYRVLCDPKATNACPNGARCGTPDAGDTVHPACAGL